LTGKVWRRKRIIARKIGILIDFPRKYLMNMRRARMNESKEMVVQRNFASGTERA